jgi:hypothetical protein
MNTITTEQFNNALAFLRNRHRVELSQTASSSHERHVTVDGRGVSREDAVRMAETEGSSDGWKPSGPSHQ